MPLCRSRFDATSFRFFEGDTCPDGWESAVTFRGKVVADSASLFLIFLVIFIVKGVIDA